MFWHRIVGLVQAVHLDGLINTCRISALYQRFRLSAATESPSAFVFLVINYVSRNVWRKFIIELHFNGDKRKGKLTSSSFACNKSKTETINNWYVHNRIFVNTVLSSFYQSGSMQNWNGGVSCFLFCFPIFAVQWKLQLRSAKRLDT